MNLDNIIANIYTDEAIVVDLTPLEASLVMAVLFVYLSPTLWDDYATDGDLIDALISDVIAKVQDV